MKQRRFVSARTCLFLLGAGLAPACGGQAPEPAAPPATAPVAAAPAPAPAATPAATAPAPAPAATTEAPAPAPAQPAAEEHHHHHGMVEMFMASVRSLELKPEQKTAIDGIEADLQKAEQQHEPARQQLVNDIADGVAAGKLDHKKVDADTAAIVKAVQAAQAPMQDAFNRIHKTLDAAQRKQLVENLRAKGKEMHEHGMGPHGEHEHDKGAGPGKEGHMGEGHMGEGHMEMLATDLALTPEQKDKLHAKLEADMKAKMAGMKQKMEAGMKHMKAVADAFEGEKFDAKQAGVGSMAPDMAKSMVQDRVKFVEAVLAVLTPDQRAKFAAHIHAHAGDADE